MGTQNKFMIYFMFLEPVNPEQDPVGSGTFSLIQIRNDLFLILIQAKKLKSR